MSVSSQTARLDEQNPWPALSPFDEDDAAFFHGRNQEAESLLRSVTQAPLTLLFGKSGLGKTSLLKAGLFPRLKQGDYLPVYVRLNFQTQAAPPIDQVKTAFLEELKNRNVEAPMLAEDETLWSYLHRCDLEFWSDKNRLLTPVFVFDQFEEVFTLGEGNSLTRRFRTDLSDLVENRIPADLSTSAETGEAFTDQLDIHCQRYKVLISLREDYLPHLESWKKEIPSLLRNRLRIVSMKGEKALSAVFESGQAIVDEDVAVDIVRFVAAAQRASAEVTQSNAGVAAVSLTATSGHNKEDLRDVAVEPALLSLLCHGLNERRKSGGAAKISRSLVESSGPSIVEDFYTRCLTGMPERVQRFIVTELVTNKGFRKPFARDDAKTEYGLTDQEIGQLVDRRLIRLDDYHGTELLELIHDVLAPVVLQHKVVEQKRLAEEQARTEAARNRLRYRYYLLAGFAAMLVVVIFFLFKTRNAEAEKRKLADKLKSQEVEKRKEADKRREKLENIYKLRRAALSQDQTELAALTASLGSEVKSNVQFAGEAQSLKWKDSHGREIYRFQIFPVEPTLPKTRRTVAFITYFANNTSFKNSLIVTTADRGFKANYDGWGCLDNMTAFIEYKDPEEAPSVAEFNMCKIIGWH